MLRKGPLELGTEEANGNVPRVLCLLKQNSYQYLPAFVLTYPSGNLDK